MVNHETNGDFRSRIEKLLGFEPEDTSIDLKTLTLPQAEAVLGYKPLETNVYVKVDFKKPEVTGQKIIYWV